MNTRVLLDIFDEALKAADPYEAVKNSFALSGRRDLMIGGALHDLEEYDRVIVVGAGKAAGRMAQAVEGIIGNRVSDGLIIVKYGHGAQLGKIRLTEAGHPVPDEAGVKGADEIIAMLRNADEKTLVICLLSGGGSALLVAPADGISLSDKQAATDLLLRAGASIYDLNTVRKHLSRIKGGRLAETAYPATIITLILSDVIGDRLDVIASGPTAPDGTTFQDAVSVIMKYNLIGRLPHRVEALLNSGAEGRIKETPKKGDACFKNVTHSVVAGIRNSIAAAQNAAETRCFEAEVITSGLQGEARAAAKFLADKARSCAGRGGPKCLISGGETTVTVKGNGAGGRNQELALAFALEIEGVRGVALLSAGTDGTDGPTDAAGAIVDGETAEKARSFGLDPPAFLENNDSYSFFKRLDRLSGGKHHLITGPTGTNVMDLQVILITRE